jgi:hypothetical protein
LPAIIKNDAVVRTYRRIVAIVHPLVLIDLLTPFRGESLPR